jgi:acyl-coenzyme A synthetase/AMP-(fatty) acid ligase
MNEQACKVANISLELGLKMKDTAAILISNEPAFICTFLGEYYHLRIILDM